MLKEKDYENVLLFLPLVTKYYTKKENHEEYLYSSFRKYSIWKEVTLWEALMKLMIEKKQEELGEQKKNQAAQDKKPSTVVNKLFSFGVKKITNLIDLAQNKTTPVDKEIYIPILNELSFYIGRLTKNLLISSEILLELAKDIIQDKREIKQLLQLQKDEIDEILRWRIEQFPLNKNKKAQTKWGKNFPIYLASDYLDVKDLVKLLALNRGTRKQFKKRVYRTIFNKYGNKLTGFQRSEIWKNILEVNTVTLNYKEYYAKFLERLTQSEKGIK
jgi:hypothetical protein